MAPPLAPSVHYPPVAGQLVTPRRLLQALEPESGRLTPLPPSPTLFKYEKLDHRMNKKYKSIEVDEFRIKKGDAYQTVWSPEMERKEWNIWYRQAE